MKSFYYTLYEEWLSYASNNQCHMIKQFFYWKLLAISWDEIVGITLRCVCVCVRVRARVNFQHTIFFIVFSHLEQYHTNLGSLTSCSTTGGLWHSWKSSKQLIVKLPKQKTSAFCVCLQLHCTCLNGTFWIMLLILLKI